MTVFLAVLATMAVYLVTKETTPSMAELVTILYAVEKEKIF